MKKILEGYKETELGVIPQEWEIKQIDDVAEEIFLGLTSKVDYVENGGFPLVRASDISKGKLSFESVKFISEEQHKKLTKLRKVEKGDVLISKSGTLGTCVIVECDTEFSIYESIIAVKIKSEIFFPKYLVQLLQDTKIQSNMLGARVGGAVGHLNLQTFRKLIISLPTLPEQQKIAEILSSVDDHIEKLDETISEYELLKKGMMKKLLTEGIGHTEFKDTELGRIPKEWEVRKLGEVCDEVTIGLVTSMTKHYVDNGIPLIRNSDIKENLIIMDKMVKLNPEFVEKNEKKRFKLGDVVTVHTGDIGTSAVIENELVGSLGFATLNSRVNEDIVSNFYYSLFLNSSIFKSQAYAVSTGDGRNNLNLKDFVNMIIAYPKDKVEQNNIFEIINNLSERIYLYKSEKDDFMQVKKGLMEKLLTGKIRVNNISLGE